jgi:hypothetical protein
MTPDPFKKAAEIARGEHDDELPDYDVIIQWLRRSPQTWNGGFLRQVITNCVVGKPQFFKDDAALIRYVEKAIAVARDPNSMLRGEK